MLDFTVSGNSLTVTANGEVLSPYDLYTQVPRYTVTSTNVSFLLPDGRVFNSIPYNGISVGGVTFSGTQNQLQTLLASTFTVSSGGTGGLTTVTTKTDDTTAFVALSNGQSADFEVGGIVSRYSKNSTGTTFKNYNTYP